MLKAKISLKNSSFYFDKGYILGVDNLILQVSIGGTYMAWTDDVIEIFIDLIILCSVNFLSWKLSSKSLNRDRITSILRLYCWAGIFFLTKDLLEIFYPNPVLTAFFDILLVFLFTRWLQQYAKRKFGDFTALSACFILLAIVILTEMRIDLGGRNLLLLFPALFMYLHFIIKYIIMLFGQAASSKKDIASMPLLLGMSALYMVSRAVALYVIPSVEYFGNLLYWLMIIFIVFWHHCLETGRYSTRINLLNGEMLAIFEFIERAGNLAAGEIDAKALDSLLLHFTTFSMQKLNAAAAAMYMIDKTDRALIPKAVCGPYSLPFAVPKKVAANPLAYEEYSRNQKINIGETILGKSVYNRKSIFVPDASRDKDLRNHNTNEPQYISSLLAVPMIVGTEVLGIITLIKKTPDEFFTGNDLSFLETFSKYASQTVETFYSFSDLLARKKTEQEKNIAQDIQKGILPQSLPPLKNLSISVYRSTHKAVGGDYCECIRTKLDNMAFVICDVAGKSVMAATIKLCIHTTIHLAMSLGMEPAMAISMINKILCLNKEVNHYATLALVVYDPKSRNLSFSNASHHPLMIIRPKTNKMIQIDTAGLPTGIDADMTYEQKAMPLNTGDILVMYTDGLPEAENSEKERYGVERLKKVLIRNSASPVDYIKNAVISDMERFISAAVQNNAFSFLIAKIE